MKEFRNRHKAFVGAAIAAATTLIGAAANNAAKARQQREMERQQNYKNNLLVNLNPLVSNLSTTIISTIESLVN